jgi:hypothetical protein
MRGITRNEWYHPSMPHAAEDVAAENRDVIAAYLGGITLVPDAGNPLRSEYQRHHMCDSCSLREAFEHLLVNVRFTDAADSQEFLFVQLIIQELLDQEPDALCSIYLMSSGKKRDRGVDGEGQIKNLFQGAAPVNPPELRGTVYLGDKAMISGENVTIQIHMLKVLDREEKKILAENVPTLAVHIPEFIYQDLLVQHQPEQIDL